MLLPLHSRVHFSSGCTRSQDQTLPSPFITHRRIHTITSLDSPQTISPLGTTHGNILHPHLALVPSRLLCTSHTHLSFTQQTQDSPQLKFPTTNPSQLGLLHPPSHALNHGDHHNRLARRHHTQCLLSVWPSVLWLPVSPRFSPPCSLHPRARAVSFSGEPFVEVKGALS